MCPLLTWVWGNSAWGQPLQQRFTKPLPIPFPGAAPALLPMLLDPAHGTYTASLTSSTIFIWTPKYWFLTAVCHMSSPKTWRSNTGAKHRLPACILEPLPKTLPGSSSEEYHPFNAARHLKLFFMKFWESFHWYPICKSVEKYLLSKHVFTCCRYVAVTALSMGNAKIPAWTVTLWVPPVLQPNGNYN